MKNHPDLLWRLLHQSKLNRFSSVEAAYIVNNAAQRKSAECKPGFKWPQWPSAYRLLTPTKHPLTLINNGTYCVDASSCDHSLNLFIAVRLLYCVYLFVFLPLSKDVFSLRLFVPQKLLPHYSRRLIIVFVPAEPARLRSPERLWSALGGGSAGFWTSEWFWSMRSFFCCQPKLLFNKWKPLHN